VSLKDRLQALRLETEENNPAARGRRADRPAAYRPPEAVGWERIADFVFRRSRVFPLPEETLGSLAAATEFFLGPLPGGAGGLLWYDTETTGLSGGAGTHVFLYGSARLLAAEVHLRQFFLADFPGEKAFLRAVMEDFTAADSPVMLSYNGRAFDAPLLRGRFILNRIPCELPPQFDLLFTARRLWKNILPDCSLGSIERHILKKERGADIPGEIIPQVYFDYLAGAEHSLHLIETVVSHHREDILSLVELFARFGRIVENPGLEAETGGLHAAALGALLEERRPGAGLPVLRKAALGGDTRALVWLSRYYKRAGAFAEAVELWTALARGNPFAALELAKYLEHRRADYEEALRLTEELLAAKGRGLLRLPGLDDASLAGRRQRLVGKIRKAQRSRSQ
jgi:tetratricopeptide (TPR) repeat protein